MKYKVGFAVASTIAALTVASIDGCKTIEDAVGAGNTGTAPGGRTYAVPAGAKQAQKSADGTCSGDTAVACGDGACCDTGTICCPGDYCADDCSAAKCPDQAPTDCLNGTCCAKECCDNGGCDSCGGSSDAAAE